jgi:hypothetical protein
MPIVPSNDPHATGYTMQFQVDGIWMTVTTPTDTTFVEPDQDAAFQKLFDHINGWADADDLSAVKNVTDAHIFTPTP